MSSGTARTNLCNDYVAKLDVNINGRLVQGLILEGRSGLNLISKAMPQSLGMRWEPLTFNIRMADKCMVVPKGVEKSARIQITGIEYVVDLVVLTMKNLTTTDTYQMLLGWPWLRYAKVEHD